MIPGGPEGQKPGAGGSGEGSIRVTEVAEAGEEEPNVRARCPLWCGEGAVPLLHMRTHSHP